MSDRGHRLLPHTADSILTAWAPTREECLSEAISGLVSICADPTGQKARQTVTFTIAATDDAEQLLRVLGEVIYLLDVQQAVPVRAEVVRDGGGGLTVTAGMVPVDAVRATGPAPKAISRHGLVFAPDRGGWTCSVTVDV